MVQGGTSIEDDFGDVDELFKNAVEVVLQYDHASAGLIQRRLSVGYARAARFIDQLEAAGVVGPAEGSTPRKVLIEDPEELFGKNWEKLRKKEDREKEAWMPEPPKNYKVPSDVKLSKVNGIPWGTQFGDIYKRSDFKDSKAEFPIPFRFDYNGRLRYEISALPLTIK